MTSFFIAGISLFAAGSIFLVDGVLILIFSNYFKRRQEFFGAGERPSEPEKNYYFVNRYSIALSQVMYGILAIGGGIIVITAV